MNNMIIDEVVYAVSCDGVKEELFKFYDIKKVVDKLYELDINQDRKYCMLSMITPQLKPQVIVIAERKLL